MSPAENFGFLHVHDSRLLLRYAAGKRIFSNHFGPEYCKAYMDYTPSTGPPPKSQIYFLNVLEALERRS